MKVFWSWQSDTPGKIGRHFIREALKEAIDELRQPPDIEEPTGRETREALHLDQDRQGVPGSPDLARTILDKIDASTVVVADVTLVGRTADGTDANGRPVPGKKLINSNVAIELGYALRALTDKHVLLVFNAHYGKHEELPFDLRHKGGAGVFRLAPDADKDQIRGEKRKLKAHFVAALAPYLQASAARATQFPETPTTFNKAAYFAHGEPLAQAGEPNIDQVDFAYVHDDLCFIRLIPGTRLTRPMRLSTLVEIARFVPILKSALGGGLVSQNNYGAIAYEPGSNPPRGRGRLSSSTQLFENGELWSISESLIVRDRVSGMRADTRLPSLPTMKFERMYFDCLHALSKFAAERLGLTPPWQVELGIAATSQMFVAAPENSQWGPIRKPEVIYRAILNTSDPDAIDTALLHFFEEIYDATGYARPVGFYGFPPNRPGSVSVQRPSG